MSKLVSRASKQDEGYAWVILFAAFCLKVLEDGIQLSGGVLFVEFLDHFGETRSATAWIGSIMLGVLNLSGPVGAMILNKFGDRACVMLGSVIVCLSFILSYFAPSLYYLYATSGVLQGFGLGLQQLGGTIGVSKYFKKKRAFAVGLAYCGGGIGLFVLAPLIRKLIDIYTWRGAMLILAGISLNGCVFSSLFRPFISETEPDKIIDPESKEVLLKDTVDIDAVSPMEEVDLNEHNLNVEENDQSTLSDKEQTLNGCSGQNIPLLVIKDEVDEANRQTDNTCDSSGPDVLKLKSNDTDDREENLHTNELLTNPSNHSETNVEFSNPLIESIFPKAMITNSNFIILQFATVFIALPEFVPFSMLPDFALSVNCTSSQSAWTVSVIGIGATISYVISGWLSDLKNVSSVLILAVCVFGIGVTTIVVAFVPMLETMMVYGVLFGGCAGAMYLLQPIVLFEYVGEKYMAATMGVLMCVYGVSGFMGTPAAGWMYDHTGSYKVTFLVAGSSFVLSSAITCLVFCNKTGNKKK